MTHSGKYIILVFIWRLLFNILCQTLFLKIRFNGVFQLTATSAKFIFPDVLLPISHTIPVSFMLTLIPAHLIRLLF